MKTRIEKRTNREVAARDLLIRTRDQEMGRLAEPDDLKANVAATVPGDEADVAAGHNEAEMSARLSEHRRSMILAINSALERLDGGEYGLCQQCGGEIALERLQVLPFAPLCFDCQNDRETRKARGAGSEEAHALL
ncbi:MAG TPA: TraR/DksA C4-type zinc finger protein [Candidatus Binataceae bacterium]